MSRKANTTIFFGLCVTLAACDGSSTNDLTSPPIAATGAAGLRSTSNAWATKRTLSPWREGMAVGTINGTIYVVGGRRSDLIAALARVDAYNVASNTWSQLASMPGVRLFPNGASAVNGKLYVSGGLNGNDSDGKATKTLFVYDPGTNSWTRKADMPHAGLGGIQAVIGGQLYVYMSGLFFRYDPATNVWKNKAAPPNDHQGGAGGVINGKLYLASGIGADGSHTKVDVYAPASNTWGTAASLPQFRFGMAGAVLNGKLFLVGGADGFSEHDLPKVESFNPQTNTWTTKASLPIGSSGGAATTAGGKIYFISGRVVEGNIEQQPGTTGPSEVYAYTP